MCFLILFGWLLIVGQVFYAAWSGNFAFAISALVTSYILIPFMLCDMNSKPSAKKGDDD